MAQCITCGTSFDRKSNGHRYCSAACRPSTRKVGTTCRTCGVVVPGKGKKFCSIDCMPEKSRREHERYLNFKKSRYVPIIKTCIACDKEFQAGAGNAKFCSPECRNTTTISHLKVCAFCSSLFITNTKATRFCSLKCAQGPRALHAYASETERQTIKGHRRRAKIKQVYVEDVLPSVVFERDGWVCQLCHEPVDQTLHGWNRMAASLDHIIPLAQGGLHCYSNVQLAHKSCNSSKGARWSGQLTLI